MHHAQVILWKTKVVGFIGTVLPQVFVNLSSLDILLDDLNIIVPVKEILGVKQAKGVEELMLNGPRIKPAVGSQTQVLVLSNSSLITHN